MTMPSYLIAADSHSVLNGAGNEDESLLDSVGNSIAQIPKFVGLSLGSGLAEAWNTIPTVGNWLGGEFDRIDYKAEIANLDDDLSTYYTKHQLGVDTVGFIAGSLVPGMLGVKVLKAGQTVLRGAMSEGVIGGNLAEALGFLAPRTEQNLAKAINAIRDTGNPFRLIETNTLRALGSGFGQAALESAAFETMVAATMSQSPVLKDMDVSDLFWNGVIGVGLGGVIGGTVGGLFTAGTIKRAGTLAEQEMAPWSITRTPQKAGLSTDKILDYTDQLREIPAVPAGHALEARITRTSEATRNSLLTNIRSEFGRLADGDEAIAQSQFDLWKILEKTNPDQNIANLLDGTATGRASAMTSVERELNRIERKISTGLLQDITAEEADTWSRSRVSWIKMRGENAGDVAADRPEIFSLTDRMKAGDTIQLTKKGDGIQIGSKVIRQENNPYRAFNIFNLSHYDVEARYLWSEMLPKWTNESAQLVHATDIPLLQKAYRDGLESLRVIPEGKAADEYITLGSKEQITKFIQDQKLDIADRFGKTIPAVKSVDDVVDRLKSYFGINFNIVDDPMGGYNGFWKRISEKLKIVGGKDATLTGDTIAMDRAQTLTRSIYDVAKTLKHEEGHGIFQTLLDARGISRLNLEVALPDLRNELVSISKKQRPWVWKSNDPRMIDYRNSNHELFADAFSWLSMNNQKLKAYPAFDQFAGHLIRPVPQEVLDSIAVRTFKPTTTEIAKIVDVNESILRGEITPEGFFAREGERTLYKKQMEATGTRPGEQLADPLHLPSWVKVVSKEQRTRGLDNNVLEGFSAVAERARLYEESAKRVSAPVIGEELPDLGLKEMLHNKAGGPTALMYENASYGTAGSTFAYVGQRVHNIIKNTKQGISDLFTPTLQKLANNTDAAIEWSVLNEKLRSLPQKYYLNEDGSALVYGKVPMEAAYSDVKQFQKAMESYQKSVAEMISAGEVPAEIPIKNDLVRQLVKDHIGQNGKNINNLKPLRANEGFIDRRDPDAFYPLPKDPKDTPYFAFVLDESVQGTGHSSMIYAASADDLAAMKNSILQKTSGLKILTKEESEQYFKSRGQFEFERTLSERNINWELKRNGVSASFLPTTDPSKIVQDFLDWHLARGTNVVREAVAHRYSRQFDTLRTAAAESMQAAKSKLGYSTVLEKLESGINDPSMNLIKMALDIQRTSDYPYWSNFGTMLDSVVSKAWHNVSSLWETATSPEHLTAINSALNKAGYGNLVVDEALYKMMNASVPRGTLSAVVNKMNGLLGSIALRMDPLNALNNLVGTSVLLGTELKSVMRAIKQANPEAVGKLAELTQIAVPGGGGATITSPTKLIANSIRRISTDPALKEYYTKYGFRSTIIDQYDQTMDAMALTASDSISSIDAKISKAMKIAKTIGDNGEKLTGNSFAESYSRLLTADVMKQITEVAVESGAMTEITARTYINTFVNRVQGNYIASQRPMMFQGPVGQAIGLFQTYQFNLLQQLFRHIADGNMKNVATMMGLQGTIYGMNGLPAFNAINTHIIGNASGNKNHTDLYQASYNAAGKEAGDWLMYGGLSNALGIFHPDLKMNMYSRGDINPRQATLIPVDPAKIPIVQAFTKMVSNLYDIGSKTAAGGDVFGTFMRALEHNGVSRPLAGMAQVMEGFARPDKMVISTSNKDNILMAHDLMNLASGVRVLGGKPLDEALVNDAMFRINAYKAKDSARMETLGEAIKISALSGDAPDQAQVDSFMQSYVQRGGKQDKFVQFMTRQYKNINASQANQLRQHLTSPHAVGLQRLMGGMDLEDLHNTQSPTATSSSE